MTPISYNISTSEQVENLAYRLLNYVAVQKDNAVDQRTIDPGIVKLITESVLYSCVQESNIKNNPEEAVRRFLKTSIDYLFRDSPNKRKLFQDTINLDDALIKRKINPEIKIFADFWIIPYNEAQIFCDEVGIEKAFDISKRVNSLELPITRCYEFLKAMNKVRKKSI